MGIHKLDRTSIIKIMALVATITSLVTSLAPLHVHVLARLSESSCVEDYMYVPVIVLNAPWNGKAEFTKSFYIQWEFGSIVTSYTQFSWSETARVYNGVNAIEYVFARVRVCGSYAQVLQWFNDRYATTYEAPGDKIDDTCLKLVTVVCDVYGNCRTSGSFTTCPTYSPPYDLRLTYCNGYEKNFEMTASNAIAAGIDISISMGSVSINDILRTNLLAGAGVKAVYDIVAPQNTCATWYIDYLKASAQTPIWAFYVVDPPQQAVNSSRRAADKCVMRLELEEVVLMATNSSGVVNAEVVSRARKPFKEVIIDCPRRHIEVGFVNDKAIVSISSEVRDAVKDVVWKIHHKAGYRWHAVPGNEAVANLTMRGVHSIVLRKADGYSTTVVVEVVLKNGSRIVEEIGIGGYIPDTHLS